MDRWQAYIIAILIGLLVGIERERSSQKPQAMGIRTFLLISLLGALAGGLEELWLSIIVAIFSLSLISISYFNSTKDPSDEDKDVGLTTEFAGGIIFCLGFLAHTVPVLSAVFGAVVAIILFSKQSLHSFTHAIKASELEAALVLFLTGVIVIGLVPDDTIDPWGIFNPKRFGYLILLLACLEFFSYVFAKILGQKKGLLFVGFLGGFVSSTNVLLSSARLSVKNPEAWRLHLSSALAAKLASFAELLLIILWIAPKLFISIIWAVGAAIGIGALQLRFFAKQRLGSKAEFQMKSPLDWKGVIRLSLLFSLIIAGISAAKMWMGDKASAAVSFMTALFELQGVSLANATMFIHDQLELKSAAFNVLLAVNASLISKIAISWIVARGPFAKYISFSFITLIFVVIAVGWLTI